jgi:hypothetical protein
MGRSDGRAQGLFGLLAWNGGMGVALGILMATVLVAADAHGLAGLMGKTIGLFAGWALLAFLFGSAFGSIAAATAIMWLGHDDSPQPPLLPAEAAARPKRGRRRRP